MALTRLFLTAIGFEDVDLEGDFDPEAHDQAMEGAFNDQYYEEEEDVQFDADGKPIWNDDIDIDDILVEEEALAGKGKKKDKGKRKAAGADDERMEMDADFLEDDNGGLEDDKVDLSTLSKKERKKLKKKQKKQKEQEAKRRQAAGGQTEGGAGEEGGVNFDDMNAEQKPLSVEEIQSMAPEERKKKVGDMVDNYYAMDYEDMVSKARFALRTVLHADLMSRT
jgi:protein KRI1